MKYLASRILLALLVSGAAGAQEGFSPTLPFGTKGMERTQAPVNNPYQAQYMYQPYRNGNGCRSNYYYGPNGVVSNGYYTPYGQTPYPPANRSSANYKSQSRDYNSVPGYNQPLEQHAPPGY
jgi:hypothetical protein